MIVFQIGTCTGSDDLTGLIQDKNIDLLVLVEPMDIHNESILNCYKDVKNKALENIAIVDDETVKECHFYYHEDDGPRYETASFNPRHVAGHRAESRETYLEWVEDGLKIKQAVKCMTINNLFKKYDTADIDILFIDAEGMDDNIIRSIDFNRFNIKEIYFENLHLQTIETYTHPRSIDIYQYLQRFGYSVIKKWGFQGWTSRATKEKI